MRARCVAVPITIIGEAFRAAWEKKELVEVQMKIQDILMERGLSLSELHQVRHVQWAVGSAQWAARSGRCAARGACAARRRCARHWSPHVLAWVLSRAHHHCLRTHTHHALSSPARAHALPSTLAYPLAHSLVRLPSPQLRAALLPCVWVGVCRVRYR